MPGPVWTERTSPPCSPPRMTGADPQTHTTSWWTRAVQMSQMKNTKETKNQEGFFSFCICLVFFQSFLCTKVQSCGYFFFFRIAANWGNPVLGWFVTLPHVNVAHLCTGPCPRLKPSYTQADVAAVHVAGGTGHILGQPAPPLWPPGLQSWYL